MTTVVWQAVVFYVNCKALQVEPFAFVGQAGHNHEEWSRAVLYGVVKRCFQCFPALDTGRGQDTFLNVNLFYAL